MDQLHLVLFTYRQRHCLRDPLGRRTTQLYDSEGRLGASVRPIGTSAQARTSNTYDLANRNIAVINPLGFRTSTVYDAAGRRSGESEA